MLFTILQLSKYLFLMATVIFGTAILKKTKLREKPRKIANAAVVIIAVIFFFIPFKEILTFRSADTAFSAAVLGEKLTESDGNDTCGAFFRDKRGTFSTIFFYKEDGKYRICPSENRLSVWQTEKDGVYLDLYRIDESEDYYLLIRGYTESLSVRDSQNTVFETKTLNTSNGALTYTMAHVSYTADDLANGTVSLFVNDILMQ